MEQSAESSISVQLELKNDGTVDLPSSIEYMKRQMRMGHCHITLESINAENMYFIPNIDTLIVDYQYNIEPVITAALGFESKKTKRLEIFKISIMPVCVRQQILYVLYNVRFV